MIKVLLLLSLALVLLSSCVSVNAQKENVNVKKAQKPMDEMKEINFRKIKNVDVGLELVSPLREFKAGKPVKLTFRLRNYSLKPLVVYEWMMQESNNLRIYYVPWVEKMKKPDKKDWKAIIPKCGEKPKRLTLELAHRNFVLIDKTLPFVEKLELEAPQTYILYAELNLTSISARSRYFKIQVNP